MRRLTFAVLLALAAPALARAAEPKIVFTVVRPNPWGPHNLNPLIPGDQHLLPTLSAIYETLFCESSLDGKVTEVLGTRYEWSKDARTLTVTTRDGVLWSDGQPFGPKDVVLSFNLLKKFPALDLNGLWKNGLAEVAASGPNTVVFRFSAANVPIFQFVAHQPIVPEHVWSKVEDPVTFANPKPVATGPFVFETYSAQALRVLRNPNYWMKGKPAVDAVVWLSTASNEAAMLKLLKNEADFGFVAAPDPKAGYAAKGPNYAYWWPVNSANFLYFNTTKAPFSDPAFRRALSMAVDTKDVAIKGYSGVVSAADLSAIIPAQQKEWLPPGGKALAFGYDPAAAEAAFVKAGYAKDASGKRLDSSGKPFPAFKILVGSGWTDYITMAQVISENLKKVGIETVIDQQVWGSYSGGFRSATYDMGISWGWGAGANPYYLYYASFAPELSAPVGENAVSNLTRYTHPAVTQALQQFRESSDPAVRRAAVATMVTQVMKDLPWLPLTERCQFELLNTSRFTGFPSDSDPYNDGPADDRPATRLMFLNLKPKS